MTQFVKICNIFINERSGTLCFTNENGDLTFYEIKKGTELLKYIEVSSIILILSMYYVLKSFRNL